MREALSGEQGLESARAEHPDVMLLDVRLPDVSGIEVCRRIKAEPALADVFIIMVSGEAMSPAETMRGLEVGADEYLAKPVSLNELQARIRTALRLRDATAALRVSEEYHRRLFEILPDALFVLNSRGRIVTVNSRAVRLLGYAEARELRGKSVLRHVRPKARGRLRADIAALSRTGILQNAPYEAARRDGSKFPIALSASQIKENGGRTIGVVCVARDISDEKRAEKGRTEGLRAAEARHRTILENAMVQVSEREQRRVGQDLHDGLCQRLFCAALGCNLLREDLAAQSRPEAAQAAEMLAQLQAAIGEARSLAYGLSPANLHERGLAAALGDLASTTSLDCRVPCQAECPGPVAITDAATATHLYRIAREAVHNAVKHASPSRILIRLEATAEGLRLSVADDGCGIPEGQSPGPGMGVPMMRHLANLLGGEFRIQRAPAGGTIVTATFPENTCESGLMLGAWRSASEGWETQLWANRRNK